MQDQSPGLRTDASETKKERGSYYFEGLSFD